MKKVNILGTEYTIEKRKKSDDKILKENNYCGYCCVDEPLIVIADADEEEYFPCYTEDEKKAFYKVTLRHELVHAFLNESGLQASSNKFDDAWARNEEMIDWFAIQFPKIAKVYSELGIM